MGSTQGRCANNPAAASRDAAPRRGDRCRLVVAACARTERGTARTEPVPHVFPDLGRFTEANLAQYYVPLRGGPTYQFGTPSGLHCEFNGRGPWCSGRFSSNPYSPDDDVCSLGGRPNAATSNDEHVYQIERADKECQSTAPDNDRILDAGNKLTIDWPDAGKFACAVGPADRVACIDQIRNHGFVIEPTGAWTF